MVNRGTTTKPLPSLGLLQAPDMLSHAVQGDLHRSKHVGYSLALLLSSVYLE